MKTNIKKQVVVEIFFALMLLFSVTTAYAVNHSISGSNFTMLDPVADVTGGSTDVNGTFDDTRICTLVSCTDIDSMTLASSQPFFSQLWTAHTIRVFGPGTYSFDSGCTVAEIQTTGCPAGSAANSGPTLTLTVAPGQLGAHILFDWLVTFNIDVAVLWDYKDSFGAPIYDGDCGATPPGAFCDLTQTPTRAWSLVSRDGDGDGIRGIAMVDGAFPAFSANFNLDMTPELNAPPIANDDNAGVVTDTVTDIVVLTNDTDLEDGSPPPAPPAIVTPTAANSSQGFALSAKADGTITYTPTGGFTGSDDFQYTLIDSDGGVSLPATVNITVGDPNAPPVTSDPTIPTDEDTSADIPVTVAAVDPDGDLMTYSIFDAISVQGGVVAVDVTNTILTYTPATNFNGSDTFTYVVTDGIADSNVGTMTIDVSPVNDALVCSDVTLSTDSNTALLIDVASELLSTCTDPDVGDTITLDSTTQPTVPGSMLTFDGVNTLTYTPATDYNGADDFTYTATDGTVTDTRAVTLQVGADFGNFTMLDSGGNVFGGTNDVLFDWDGTLNTVETDTNFNITIASNAPWPFQGFVWIAHDIRVFGPGTYSFDTGCTVAELQASGCPAGSAANSGPPLSMTVGANQLGVHILFDWNVTANIDVVNVWNADDVWDTHGDAAPKNALWLGTTGPSPDPDTTWAQVSTDVNGDGINGAPMVDGPFQGFYANFNASPGASLPPPPSYTGTAPDTKLGSGLFASPMNPWVLIAVFMTLIGVRRFSNKLYR